MFHPIIKEACNDPKTLYSNIDHRYSLSQLDELDLSLEFIEVLISQYPDFLMQPWVTDQKQEGEGDFLCFYEQGQLCKIVFPKAEEYLLLIEEFSHKYPNF